MPIELLEPTALSDADTAAWEELAKTAAERNPFFEPAFVIPASRHLASERPLLLVDRADGGSWRFFMPVVRRRRWRRVPVPCVVAWNHLYSYFGAPLVSPGTESASANALLDWASAPRCPTFLGLDLLPPGGFAAVLAAEAERRGRGPVRYEQIERAALTRREDGAYLAINRKHQREVARMGRRLGEELGGKVNAVDRAGDPAAIDSYLDLEASGWKGHEGTAFESLGHSDLLREICAEFHRRGRLELLSLEAGGRPVAILCNLISGSTLFMFKIAFDEQLARFSPGIQLLVATVERFEGSPALERVDSCALPGNEMINRLWAGRRELCSAALPAPGALGRLGAGAVRAGSFARGGGGTIFARQPPAG
jgi:CelD/BcsL family acetyltransferase involved in cellulose biosynthesis